MDPANLPSNKGLCTRTDFDDVPDASSLNDLAHGAEELAEELNTKDDEQIAEVSRRLLSETASDAADKVSVPP